LKKEDVDQLIEYIEWASRLIPGSNLTMIQGVLVGCEFGNKDEDRKGDLLNRIREAGKTYRIKAFQYIVEGVKRLLFLKR
jgi:hypothetical protein